MEKLSAACPANPCPEFQAPESRETILELAKGFEPLTL